MEVNGIRENIGQMVAELRTKDKLDIVVRWRRSRLRKPTSIKGMCRQGRISCVALRMALLRCTSWRPGWMLCRYDARVLVLVNTSGLSLKTVANTAAMFLECRELHQVAVVGLPFRPRLTPSP